LSRLQLYVELGIFVSENEKHCTYINNILLQYYGIILNLHDKICGPG